MEYRTLGRSGLNVSAICVGTMMFGAEVTKARARRMLAMAREAGVNFIDTAENYAGWRSEAVVGELVARQRDSWVLATKTGSVRDAPPGFRGLTRKWILGAIEGSLRRLGTDYVDIYYCHRDDPVTPLEETIGAIGDVIRQGKARYWGFSNYFGWRIGEIVRIAERLGVPRPVACQPLYNIVDRTAETDILPACGHYGIGVVPYSPLARGVLTAKYAAGRPPPRGSRAGRREARILETEMRDESFEAARAIAAHAARRGMSAGQFAFNWVLNNALVSAAIAGPRTIEQWRDYLDAPAHPWTAEDEAFVESLVPAGHASTPGYIDPKHPPTGRVPRTGRA